MALNLRNRNNNTDNSCPTFTIPEEAQQNVKKPKTKAQFTVDNEKKAQTGIEFSSPEEEKVKIPRFRKQKEVKPESEVPDDKTLYDSDYDYKLEQDSVKEMKRDITRTKIRNRGLRLGNFALIVAGIYIIFLIYGCIMTSFQYDKQGKLAPVVMTYQDIKEKKNFEQLIIYYFRARDVYETLLKYDYELSQDSSMSVTLGTKYNGILDDIDKLSTKVKAVESGVKYENLQLMLQNVVAEMSAYANAMSKALLQNSSDSANEALQRRENVYQKFMLLGNNFASIADYIKGIDRDEINDISSWSPDDYIKTLMQ